MAETDILGVIADDPLLFAVPMAIVIGFLILIWKKRNEVTGETSTASNEDVSFMHEDAGSDSDSGGGDGGD